MASSQETKNAQKLLREFLEQFDLGSLTSYAWGLMEDGVPMDQVVLFLYDRPEFKARFPALEARRKANLPPLSPQQYIALEGTYRQIMRASGMPSGWYDQPGDFTTLIANDISPVELQTRVEKGFQAVAFAPPEVREAFRGYFGLATDAAMAAVFLDPQQALPKLLEMVEVSQVGGAASMLDFDLTRRGAEELVDFGVTFESALQGFRTLTEMQDLFTETVGEAQAHLGPMGMREVDPSRGVVGPSGRQQGQGQGQGGGQGGRPRPRPEDLQFHDDRFIGRVIDNGPEVRDPGVYESTGVYNDLSAELHGLAAVFGTDPVRARLVQRRLRERQAAFAGGGGALYDEGGSGLGAGQ